MNTKLESAEKRLRIDLTSLKKSIEEFKKSDDDADKYYHWGAFLKYFRNTIHSALNLGGMSTQARGTTSKLRSEKDKDPVVRYLVSARNTDDHSDEKEALLPAEAVPGSITVAGFLTAGFTSESPGGRIAFSGCFVDGYPVDGMIDLRKGRPQVFSSSPVPMPVAVKDPEFRLNPGTTKKGNPVPVPVSDALPTPTPELFAEYAVQWIEKHCERIRKEIGEEQG